MPRPPHPAGAALAARRTAEDRDANASGDTTFRHSTITHSDTPSRHSATFEAINVLYVKPQTDASEFYSAGSAR